MDFSLPEHIETLRLKTRDFVNQNIIPLESDISSYDAHENINEDLLDLNKFLHVTIWYLQYLHYLLRHKCLNHLTSFALATHQ